MNDTPLAETPKQNTSPPPYKSPLYKDPDYLPIEEAGFSQILNHLLKKPLSVIYEINHGERNPLLALLAITLVCLSIFGFVLGMFSAGAQLWAAPAKVVGGVLFSGVICLPSLYIFGALGGMQAKIQQIIGLMLTFLSITALLLVGFAPILWLFSTSSNSLVFFGFLSIGIWLICLIFGLRVITRASKSMGRAKGGHLHLWAIIYMLVTVQMTTTLRPIIGEYDQFINLTEKKFFLVHWGETLTGKNTSDPPVKKSDTQKKPHNHSGQSSDDDTNPYLDE